MSHANVDADNRGKWLPGIAPYCLCNFSIDLKLSLFFKIKYRTGPVPSQPVTDPAQVLCSMGMEPQGRPSAASTSKNPCLCLTSQID